MQTIILEILWMLGFKFLKIRAAYLYFVKWCTRPDLIEASAPQSGFCDFCIFYFTNFLLIVAFYALLPCGRFITSHRRSSSRRTASRVGVWRAPLFQTSVCRAGTATGVRQGRGKCSDNGPEGGGEWLVLVALGVGLSDILTTLLKYACRKNSIHEEAYTTSYIRS